ncbi:hypothetical protein ANCCAN_07586 [Ancylostoma caninum]|uniref:Uncharacterized protein n=1 Tax=Ancylostoma caninum TaxID=29170 RepID=A0A368GS06_ANCCA|nr:hypothetical protein ANCCAN_07586 [Ancylostoma caninum]
MSCAYQSMAKASRGAASFKHDFFCQWDSKFGFSQPRKVAATGDTWYTREPTHHIYRSCRSLS